MGAGLTKHRIETILGLLGHNEVLADPANRREIFEELMDKIQQNVASTLFRVEIRSDAEIERVSRMTIGELFATYGEEEFRALENRVLERLLKGGPRIVSTGEWRIACCH